MTPTVSSRHLPAYTRVAGALLQRLALPRPGSSVKISGCYVAAEGSAGRLTREAQSSLARTPQLIELRRNSSDLFVPCTDFLAQFESSFALVGNVSPTASIMHAANNGAQTPEEYHTAESDHQEGTMMTMNMSAMYATEQRTGISDRSSVDGDVAKGRQPAAIVTATVVRTALVGVSIYQSKVLRQCASFLALFLLFLLLWLFIYVATSRPAKKTTVSSSTETSIPAFDTTPASLKSTAANETTLLVGFEALSLLNDMTMPNHVLDIDSFPE